MSLRVRLVLLIVVVVALAAVALSVVELQTLVDQLTLDAIEYSRLTGQLASALLRDHIERYSEDFPTPQSVEETKALWNQIVSDDTQLRSLLVKMMASSSSQLDINVAGENGIILASSNDKAVQTPMQRHQDFETWEKAPWYRRTLDLLTAPGGLGDHGGLGAGDHGETHLHRPSGHLERVFARCADDQIGRLGLISGGAIGLSLLLTMLATTRALRPVKRIEDSIDRIAQGRVGGEEPAGSASG